ncbi:hypothetical protein [Phenylobacterium sp.]|uniref:hypothetical protein n=1 Tax=Phenylobacterium sp. TaxID=1871053 RepID=UPI0035B35165
MAGARISGSDFGGSFHAAGMIGLLAMLLTIPGYILLSGWLERRAEIRAWTIDGPPCPQPAMLDPKVVGTRPAKVFSYRGARFARQSGHASCVALDEGGAFERRLYTVCQFNAPAGLAVTTDAGTWRFQPGAGRNITVTVRGGRAACVLNGWFEF